MKARLIVIFLLFVGSIYGQDALNTPVTISLENALFTEALYALIDQANLEVTFSNKIIPADKRVNLRVVKVPAKHVLRQLLEGTGLEYRLVGTQVIIVKKRTRTKQRFVVSGFVRDTSNGERVIGATIYDGERRAGTYTNEHGFFSITLTEGKSLLEVSSLGYESDSIQLFISANQQLEIALAPAFLTEVVVHSRDSGLVNLELGNPDLNLAQASILPGLGGEADIMRLAYTLPGFQAGTDGFGGISVRGGNVDQNLFLLDGVPVYNATHGVGIFSIYNSSAVRSVKVLKGAFPAKYGGRVSSVWDIQTKEGNSKQFQGELDLGLSSGKLTLERPLNKGKGSVFLSGRRAFFDFSASRLPGACGKTEMWTVRSVTIFTMSISKSTTSFPKKTTCSSAITGAGIFSPTGKNSTQTFRIH